MTQYHPSGLPKIKPSGAFETPSCEGLEHVVPDYSTWTREQMIPIMYGPIDFTKCKLSPRTMKSILDQYRLKRSKGVKKLKSCWRHRRKKEQIRNLRRADRLKRAQQRYRDSPHGKWMFLKKLYKFKGIPFEVQSEEFQEWIRLLGDEPVSGVPYYKHAGRSKRGFLIERIDKSLGFTRDNVQFLYQRRVIATARELMERGGV